MKKMFIASCIMAAVVFAAPEAAAPAAAPATEAPTAEAPATQASAAEQPAAPTDAPVAETPTAEEAPATEAVTEEEGKAATAEQTAAAPAEEGAKDEAQAATPAEGDAPAEVAATEVAEEKAAEPAAKPKKKKRKKKKMIENAVMSVNQINFDINADFELEAGKVLWTSEDDEMGDNLETWNGEANFAVLAEADDFKGKIGIAFYPGDLKAADDNRDKDVKKRELREGTRHYSDDYFSLDEAWAMQETDLFTFKVGRWDNTDKSGDYFGGYIDGYLSGFLSTQAPENQLQFGFIPSDNMSAYISLISKSENLDKGDIRAAFNFHDLAGISNLKVQLAYRSNLFDAIYDSKTDIKHNASMKANLPIVTNVAHIFAEAALMNLSDDLVIPLTGGIAFYTPVVDRIIIEAEYVGDRHEHKDFVNFDAKHVKDVLGAIYLEKAFTDRFSLSAGFHNYGSTKDYMISGNLVGRIN